MPLFGSRREPSPEPVQYAPPPKKHGLFHRDPSPPISANSSRSSGSLPRDSRHHGTNNRHSVDSAGRTHPQKTGGFLHRTHGLGNTGAMDPSIVNARERVMNAEAAETQADRALNEARLRVREARAEVRRLEEEAKEEARLAKIKQHHAAEVSKRGKHLGRHGA